MIIIEIRVGVDAMLSVSVGNKKKNGCLVDNESKILTYYEFLNLVERFKGKKHIHSIRYDEIFYIEVFSHVINEVRSGSINIFLKVHLWNGKIHYFPIYFNDTTREEIRNLIKVLQASSLDIRDEKGLFDEIVDTDQNMWVIVESVNKK